MSIYRYYFKKKLNYFLIVGSTPRVIWGSQTPQSPLSNSGPGYIWWSIQFDRVVSTYSILINVLNRWLKLAWHSPPLLYLTSIGILIIS